MLELLSPVTLVVGALGALLPCFQIAKMIRERNAHGISVPFVVGGLVTALTWLSYGLALGRLALIAPDLVAVVVGTAYLGTVLALRRRYPYRLSLHARTVEVDHELDAELAALVAAYRADRLAEADTPVLPPLADAR